MTEQETYAAKISKLLRKAESTSSSEEAQALFEKAQSLMVKYAIDEALLNDASDKPREDIIEGKYEFTGIYQMATSNIGFGVGPVNDCRVLKSTYGGKRTTCHLIGFESDVANAKLLISSLEIQALSAMKAWWADVRDTSNFSWYTPGEAYKARREFIFGFGNEVVTRLKAGRKSGIAEATTSESKRSSVEETVASDTVALVLKGKSEQVDDWVDKTYGRLRAGRASQRSYGGNTARGAGTAAGARADIGNTRVGGGKGRLGSGS